MRRFLTHILLIICVVLLFDVGYTLIIGGNLRTHARKYLEFPDKVKLLVLGDSHALMAWSSSDDKMVYNFANGSDNITDMTAKFDYASENNTQSDGVVVLSFEPHLISPYREVKQNNRINSILNHRYLSMRFVNALPLLFDPGTEFDFKRFGLALLGRKEVDSSRVFSTKAARSRFRQHFPNDEVSKKLLNEYQELINSIRKRNYEIIGIKYPVHPYFDSILQNDPKSKYLATVMDSLAQVNNLMVLDFSTVIKDPDLFRDQDHLNKEGSTIFVDEFYRRFGINRE